MDSKVLIVCEPMAGWLQIPHEPIVIKLEEPRFKAEQVAELEKLSHVFFV
jgi:hypothetical protein